MKKIAITMGDPAGIGPEIILKSLSELDCSNLLLIGNREIFSRVEKFSGYSLPQNIEFFNIEYDISKIVGGIENSHSGELAYRCLNKACELISDRCDRCEALHECNNSHWCSFDTVIRFIEYANKHNI